VRASRLVELLLWLQMRGNATANELAEALEVSVRTIYRDVEALAAAGVPVYAETGRNGGIRLDHGYRVGGLPRLDERDARSMLLTAIPSVARDLGLDTAGAERTLLSAMHAKDEGAAVALRDRLLVEADDWFREREAVPFLAAIARAVWETRELRISYTGRARTSDVVLLPLGLVLKGDTWYLLARTRARSRPGDRMYRVARVVDAEVLEHRFDRPTDFNLATAWATRTREFIASRPRYPVRVRVSRDGESLLGLLEEGTPALPLPDDVARDNKGWALLDLRFERAPSAARLLLRLGASVEVLEPVELRTLMATEARGMERLYSHGS
jgi:predicted DNA-binding transcriptional regulator YafY